MLLRFTKMHGLGNDFVVLDQVSQDIKLRGDQVRALANRHLGIGFDQLLTVEPPSDTRADFLYRIFNANGEEVEQCGNGARCLILFVRDRGLTSKDSIVLETKGGYLYCQVEEDGKICVNMGAPKLKPQDIPFLNDSTEITYDLFIPKGIHPGQEPNHVTLSAINIGNPHVVVLVEDISTAPVNELGPFLERHKSFPKNTNVNFMEIISRDEVALRVHERGVGETLACGTGACAAVVAGRLQKRLDSKVKVHLPGGTLLIRWSGGRSDIHMTGPACRVYEGRIEI